MTQHSAIIKYLQLNRETGSGLCPSYALEKVTLCGKWVGTRGTRSARDLASNTNCLPEHTNKITVFLGREIDWTSSDMFGKPIDKLTAYYKASPPRQVIPYYVAGELVSQKVIW